MERKKGNLLYKILLFLPLTLAYYILSVLVLVFPVSYMTGADSGGWVIVMIISLIVCPILSIVTLSKIFNSKNKMNKQ